MGTTKASCWSSDWGTAARRIAAAEKRTPLRIGMTWAAPFVARSAHRYYFERFRIVTVVVVARSSATIHATLARGRE